MSTPSRTYRISKDKLTKFKRQTNLSLLIPYLFPLGLIGYQLVKTGFNSMFVLVAIGVLALTVAVVIFSIKRSNKRIDTMQLAITEELITLSESGKPGQQIKSADLKAVETSARGLELKSKTSLKNPFIIFTEFEKYDEIKKLLQAKAAKNR